MNILKNEQVSIKLKNLGIMIIGVIFICVSDEYVYFAC